jgi:hypothetical protein
MKLTPRNRVHMTEVLPLEGKICIEVGVREGDFSFNHILSKKPALLYLIDAWQEQDPGVYQDKRKTNQAGWDEMYESVAKRFENQPVKIIRGLSVEAAAQFPPEHADFIYIDGNHQEEPCLADIRAYWPILKPGGWMCGHDYLKLPSWSGVLPAVNRWLAETGRELDLLTRADKFTSWGVQK